MKVFEPVSFPVFRFTGSYPNDSTGGEGNWTYPGEDDASRFVSESDWKSAWVVWVHVAFVAAAAFDATYTELNAKKRTRKAPTLTFKLDLLDSGSAGLMVLRAYESQDPIARDTQSSSILIRLRDYPGTLHNLANGVFGASLRLTTHFSSLLLSIVTEGVSLSADYKAPGGKMVRVRLRQKDGRIESARISGDFFLIPEDSLPKLEKMLEDVRLDENELKLLVERFFRGTGAQGLGVTPEDFVKAILATRTGDHQ